ncbi:30S ribosomal protein S2 [Candidatus Peregrinibacteria bacterium]|nr:30S ribosomal protein S2 [Candidatus Peregrinibacteria bacterium]
MSQVELKEMLAAAVHFGHPTQKWNPKMKRYLYGVYQGVHVFDLQKTFDQLQKAIIYIQKSIEEGKTILFVSTKQQAASVVETVAKKCGMPFVTHKWIGGLLTNFATVKKRIKHFQDLLNAQESGEFVKYTKKEASKFKKELEKLQTAFGGLKNLNRLPDILFVIDTVRDNIAIQEAKKLHLPLIAITDSNSNPDEIDYPIPGNDDAVKSLKYFLAKIEDAILNAKNKKK